MSEEMNIVVEKEKKTYRTRPYDVDYIPDKMAIITNPAYMYALSFNCEQSAYLKIIGEDRIRQLTEKKRIGSNSSGALPITSNELQDVIINEDYLGAPNLTMLREIYSIILDRYDFAKGDEPDIIVNIYMPDFLRKLGIRTINDELVLSIVKSINQFNDIIGVISDGRRKSYYSLINFQSYDADTNILEFSAPYLGKLIKLVRDESIKRDKKGAEKKKKDGTPVFEASHSYLIRPEIYKCRDRAAIENVILIVSLIERSGGFTPHISARTLVQRNKILQQQLDSNSKNHKQRVLDRTFRKTWELLRTATNLTEMYPGIQLPSPEDKTMIPRYKELDKSVYEFRHNGKKTSKKKGA